MHDFVMLMLIIINQSINPSIVFLTWPKQQTATTRTMEYM